MKKRLQNKAQWIGQALERYEKPLLRRAFQLTGDVEMAQDIVQDAFFKLCKSDMEKVSAHLARWLYTVVRNRAFDVMKKESRMNRLNDVPAVVDDRESAQPGAIASKKQIHGLVLEAIETLPELEQEAFLLKFQDELSYREISHVMGKSLGTVSKLLTNGLFGVRNHLRARSALSQEGQK